MPSRLMRPWVGLRPTTPQSAAGMRTEPPLSDPIESGTRPAATCAPAPELEPPGEYWGFHGFLIRPKSGLSPDSPSANLFMFAFPMTTAPAAFARLTTAASAVGTFVIRDFAPAIVTLGDIGVDDFGFRQRGLGQERDVGVERFVELFRAIEQGLHDLDTGEA